MIGCLILAFALCQVPAPGYYVQQGYPMAYQPAPQVYYQPAPVYYAQPAPYGYGYGAPVALNFRFGGWGGGGWGHHGRHW